VWRDVDGCNDDHTDHGRQEIVRRSRFGEQERECVLISLGLHHLLLVMKQTAPPFDLTDSSVLSAWKIEKDYDSPLCPIGIESSP